MGSVSYNSELHNEAWTRYNEPFTDSLMVTFMKLSVAQAHLTSVTRHLSKLLMARPSAVPHRYKMDKHPGTPAVKRTTDTQSSNPLQSYILERHVRQITPGCVVWLPAQNHILPGAEVDPRLKEGAFDHPAIIVSAPSPLMYHSIVEFAIVSAHSRFWISSTSLGTS